MAAQGRVQVYKVAAADIPSIAANTTGELAITILGLLVGVDRYVGHTDDLSILNAGLGAAGGEVTADDTVTLRWINATAGALNPAVTDLYITIFRGDDGSGDGGVGSGPVWAG